MSVLYVVVCAAPPALRVGDLVDQAQERGWDVCVVATPPAYGWLDVPALIQRTGHPVRHQHRMPGEPDVLPPPDAILVAPATFNTLNKWAAGITDNLALGLVCEAIGLGLPLAALPYMNIAQAAHPALQPSVERLRGAGVRVLMGPEMGEPHPPRQGGGGRDFPWHLALDALRASADGE